MVNLMTAAMSAILAATPAPTAMPETKPAPPAPGGTIIVRIIPDVNRNIENTKGNIPTQFSAEQTPDDRYNALKAKLDERFSKMFDIKKEIDTMNDSVTSKWEEYNALRQIYERQLKRIISEWVTDLNYSETPNYSFK